MTVISMANVIIVAKHIIQENHIMNEAKDIFVAENVIQNTVPK